MNDLIQRVPLGLLELLSLQGGRTPTQLHDEVQGAIDLLQLYGMNQLTTESASNGAVAEGTGVTIVMSPSNWTVLYAASGSFTKTATMTAFSGFLGLRRRISGTTATMPLAPGFDLGPFGATETGTVTIGGYLPYPLLCPPGAVVSMTPVIIGTDATAAIFVAAEFGVLG